MKRALNFAIQRPFYPRSDHSYLAKETALFSLITVTLI